MRPAPIGLRRRRVRGRRLKLDSVVGCRLLVVSKSGHTWMRGGRGEGRLALLWVQTSLDMAGGLLPWREPGCVCPTVRTGLNPGVVGHVVRVSGLRDIELRHVARYASNVTYKKKSTTCDMDSWRAACVGPKLPAGQNSPALRSLVCRAAAHRGSFASPPGERCAHFGLQELALAAPPRSKFGLQTCPRPLPFDASDARSRVI